jgi:hypothetical protein
MTKRKKFLQNPQEYFNTLNLIYYFMVAGPLCVFTYFYLNFAHHKSIRSVFPEHPDPFITYFMPLGTILFITLSYLVYGKLLKNISTDFSLKDKLNLFAKYATVKYALLEAGSFLIVAGFALSKLKFYIVLYVLSLLVFSLHRPTQHRVSKDLKLNKEEREKLWSDQDFEN